MPSSLLEQILFGSEKLSCPPGPESAPCGDPRGPGSCVTD